MSPVIRKLSFLFLLLFVVAVDTSDAQVTARSEWSGTWAATTSGGRTFMGTWTAVPDSTGATVTGTWALIDQQGRTVMDGAWSAAKSPTRWNGGWRAIITGRDGEYSGTWSSDVQLKANTNFADLFAKALESMASGSWRAGNQSGAWSIRTAK